MPFVKVEACSFASIGQKSAQGSQTHGTEGLSLDGQANFEMYG